MPPPGAVQIFTNCCEINCTLVFYPMNTPHSADQIREAAKLMYYWGDLSELLLVVIVFYQWYRRSAIKNLTAANGQRHSGMDKPTTKNQ